ncbi:nucleotidyl transferase AbiEii/AbiGii toxin family protein [Actinomycetospora sp. OC33-EN08]|uniref:Nucleotidyl transferase AbiEii/AbiGii toxin family protein n=1 Tax=Actinomycetospora aurantiaca TaxID=3129233 RepID=A0ABU8MIF5_9PSEU
MADDDIPAGLTRFQAEVARAFSSLAEASEFRLAGGSALAALRLSDRLSRDLDIFSSHGTVDDALDAFLAEIERRGWSVSIVRRAPTFCQMEVGTGQRSGCFSISP